MPIIKEDPLRRYDADGFDFKSVKGEVSQAQQFDWKRDKIDDAKKRAIYQARDYKEFTDRVLGCTLKPIHRNEFNAPPKNHAFNHSGGEKGYSTEKPTVPHFSSQAPGTSGNAAPSVFTEKVPKNGHEFERELRRRATAEDKVRLLGVVLDNGLVGKLFSRELDGEMLRQVLTAFEEVLDRGSAPNGIVRCFFVTLSVECPVSITSACAFFDAEERRSIARLLAREPATDPAEDVRVCAAFGIPVSSVKAAAAELAEEEADAEPSPEAAPAAPPVAAVPAPAPAAEDSSAGGMD